LLTPIEVKRALGLASGAKKAHNGIYSSSRNGVLVTYKLTIDVNLMDAALNVPGVETLKRWKEEGKVDLLEAGKPSAPKAAPYTWPGASPQSFPSSKFRHSKMKDSGAANFGSLAAILFPSKDPHKLTMTEINQVAHLIMHHSSKNEIFVTGNRLVIDNGRRERLKAAFGILAMDPEECVKTLAEMQGWEVAASKSSGKGSKAAK